MGHAFRMLEVEDLKTNLGFSSRSNHRRVVLVQDTRSNDSRSNEHDSCINYVNMLTLYRDKP